MDHLHSSASNLRNDCDSQHLEQLSATKEQHTCGISGMDTIHELGNILHETLQVKDENTGTGSDLPSNDDDSSGHEDESSIDGSTETSSRCLQKCATFPVSVGAEKTVPVMHLENDTHHQRSLSLPTSHKLVSAMKGSREKEGVPLRKLRVSWAPDVYDPPPTSLSHYPKKKSQQKFRSNKKHGKGKQKGKNMRGGGSGPKDKKHYRKVCGKSDKCLDTYDDSDRVMSSSNYRSSLELLDFTVDEDAEIGCPESNCGSSYLGKAGGTLHFAYAEAT